MDGAAETSVHRYGRGEGGDALAVVKLPTHRNHAAPHILTALFTHEAGVDTCKHSTREVVTIRLLIASSPEF